MFKNRFLTGAALAVVLSGVAFTGSEGFGDVPAASPASTIQRVIVVYKTHFDIGYTKLARDVLHDYRTSMIDRALTVVDQNAHLPLEQQFVWTVPGWPMKEIAAAWPGHAPERRQRIQDAFSTGRFVVHALPFTLHTDLMEPEEVARGFVFSSALNRSVGRALPRAAKMTDVPCHTWILPTLLKHAGVDFLHLGCNGHSSPVEVPPLFWWEGADGSRVLTFYSPDGYGTGLLPPPDWPHETWLALIHTGDNIGPPRPDEVRGHVARIRQALPDASVTVGDLGDFADALLAEQPDLPVVRLDMPDTWIHGPLASPIGAKIARNTRPRLAAAEALGTLLECVGAAPPSQAETVARAYEQSLLYAEHTWGLAHPYQRTKMLDGQEFQKALADGMYDRYEESWAEHRAYIDQAARLTEDLLSRNLAALASGVHVEGRRTVVFNPLPWPRSGAVLVDGTPRFVQDVPAGGWITLTPEDEPEDASAPRAGSLGTRVVENPYFRILLAADRAEIESLVDKRSGRELIRQDAESGLGALFYQQFSRADADRFRDTYTRNRNAGFGKNWLSPEVPRVDAYPRDAAWTVTRVSGQTVAEARSPAGHGVPFASRLRVTVHDRQPFVDLETFIEDKAATAWPEAIWICLPLAVESPSFRLGRLGGIVDPATDFVRASNRHLLALHTGMTVTAADGAGVGLCSPDTPLVSLDRPGAWEFSRDFVPRRPDVYVHLFNNMWSTNFRMWKSGSWSARVRLWPVASADAADSLITQSLEARYPLLVGVADGPAGCLPARADGVAVSRRGTLVTAFGRNPDGRGTLLRVWELAGRSGDLLITVPDRFAEATPVDLRGEPTGDPRPIENGRLSITLDAYSPASFILGSVGGIDPPGRS